MVEEILLVTSIPIKTALCQQFKNMNEAMRLSSRKGYLVRIIRSILIDYEFNSIDRFLICLVSIFNVMLCDDFSTHIDHRSTCVV